jgi:glucoamylase
MTRRTRLSTLLACTLALVAATGPVHAATTASATTTSGATTSAAAAPGGPGAASYYDLARKDCLGTAENTASKVWYTVADGVLSDVYEPTVDNTNVSTLQYVVTDGSTFTDLQTRDMTYTVAADPSGMACTITSKDQAHGYELTTTYVTDPRRDTVLMHTTLSALPGKRTNLAALHVYARLDAHVNGDGGGGTQNAGGNTGVLDSSGVPVVSSTLTSTEAVNRSYAVPTYMALASTSEGRRASATRGRRVTD